MWKWHGGTVGWDDAELLSSLSIGCDKEGQLSRLCKVTLQPASLPRGLPTCLAYSSRGLYAHRNLL